jgi:hypothetical protein
MEWKDCSKSEPVNVGDDPYSCYVGIPSNNTTLQFCFTPTLSSALIGAATAHSLASAVVVVVRKNSVCFWNHPVDDHENVQTVQGLVVQVSRGIQLEWYNKARFFL